MKPIIFSLTVLLSTSLSFAGDTTHGQSTSPALGVCGVDAQRQVKNIIGLNQSSLDMSKFEIRKVVMSDLNVENGVRTETYDVEFGYKDSELSYENYKVHLTLNAYPSSKYCVLRDYSANY